MTENKINKRQIRLNATKVYMHHIKEKSGNKTFGDLQKKFLKPPEQSDEDYWETNSRVFYKYSNGEICIKNLKLINDIETVFPGTKHILNSPLWLILENPSGDLETIYSYMRLLNPYIQSHLFTKDKKTNTYVRKKLRFQKDLYKIGLSNDLDALACLLCIVREMEILEIWHTYLICKWQAQDIFFRLIYCTPLKEVGKELYLNIYKSFIGKNNPLRMKYRASRIHSSMYSSPEFHHDLIWVSASMHKVIWFYSRLDDQFEQNRHTELKLLFVVFALGAKETELELENSSPKSEYSPFIINLMAAFHSKNPIAYLPKKTISSYLNNYK